MCEWERLGTRRRWLWKGCAETRYTLRSRIRVARAVSEIPWARHRTGSGTACRRGYLVSCPSEVAGCRSSVVAGQHLLAVIERHDPFEYSTAGAGPVASLVPCVSARQM